MSKAELAALVRKSKRSLSARQLYSADVDVLKGIGKDQRLLAALHAHNLRRVRRLARWPTALIAQKLCAAASDDADAADNDAALFSRAYVPAELREAGVGADAPLDALGALLDDHMRRQLRRVDVATVGALASWPPLLAAQRVARAVAEAHANASTADAAHAAADAPQTATTASSHVDTPFGDIDAIVQQVATNVVTAVRRHAQLSAAERRALRRRYQLDAGTEGADATLLLFDRRQRTARLAPHLLDAVDARADEAAAERDRREAARMADARRDGVAHSERVRAKQADSRAPRAGDGWFGMASSEVTDAVRLDNQALQLRGMIDQSRFYRRERRAPVGTRFFQVGTVVAGAGEFYSSRLLRKERRATLAQELLADTTQRASIKRRYNELQEKQASSKRRRPSATARSKRAAALNWAKQSSQ